MSKEIDLKIYWVTTVWPKWQVIIPKECRTDFEVKVWWEFEIIMLDKVAFWIWKKCEENCKKNGEAKLIEHKSFLNIWTKFQFVIPATIRKELNIEPGDTLVSIWKWKEWLWFIKNDKIEYLLGFIKEATK